MFVSSDRFANSVTHSHDVAVLCEIVDSTGTYVVQTLDVVGGSVSVDATRDVRRQCSLEVQDPTGAIIPNTVNDYLQPYSGYYVRLSRGISWPDGTQELFPLGTFAPYAPQIKDTDDSLSISLTGYDRSKLISRTRWTVPYAIAGGTNTATAIHDLIDSRMPGLRYSLQPTGASVPVTTLGLAVDNDPWKDAVAIANADGMELFFDAHDICVLRDIPDYTTGVVASHFMADENCTVLEFDRTNDASQMYTGVIVYSEGTGVDVPIRVEVWRTDTPLRIPYFFPTALITDVDQALKTANSLLRNVGRSEFAVSLTTVPDPRQEVGDIIHVLRPRSKLDDHFILSSFNMPLDSNSSMSITTTQRRVT
jgi:hypothetical protein